MIPVEAAKACIAAACRVLDEEIVELAAGLGRTQARALTAKHDYAPFPSSAMDGYALRWTPGESIVGREFRVQEVLFAGDVARQPLDRSVATKIMTGGVVPESADVILQREWADERGDRVVFRQEPTAPGMNIRPAGEDFQAGDAIFGAGVELTPSHVAILAEMGEVRVPVRRRPRVSILATGDELLEPAAALQPGKVRNSNSVYLAAELRQLGCEVRDFGIVRDREAELLDAMQRALDADVVISTGGVSVGDRDFVRPLWQRLGLREGFWRIAQKPGKPLLFGTLGNTLIFGVPGNPGSVAVCYEQYIKPALRRLLGQPNPDLPELQAELLSPIRKKQGLTHFIRSTVSARGGRLVVAPVGSQSSGSILNLATANAFIVIPADRGDAAAGDSVTVQLLGGRLLMADANAGNRS